MDLVQRSLVGQNITTGPLTYECMKRVLKGDTKAEFLWQANVEGTHTVANFTAVMNKITANIFPIYANRDQRQYMQMYLRKPPEMKVHILTMRLLQLNTYLTYFSSDHSGQLVAPLSEDKVKEISYIAMQNLWKKENNGTGIQLLKWFYPKHGRIL